MEKMAVIQWYPGHMAKALRQVKENLNMVDVVLELVDARLPESSRNPQILEVIGNKMHIMVLTKKDLADANATRNWVKYYEENGLPAVAINSNDNNNIKVIEKKINEVMADKIARQESRGIFNQRIKVMCTGIPNVGKSTLLNRLVKKNVAQVGNKPGVTKSQQWLKAGKELQLLDTPGILWPKFEDPLVGKKLALTGAIKDTLYAKDDVALYALEHFMQYNITALQERYRLSDEDLNQPIVEILLLITQRMGFKDDYDRASERLIFDVRKGKLGRYTLDQVPVAATEI
ncbi:ribosome biogenesis GTP-binding protein YlqF [Ligilactobacillus ceti DSM 22408]|uniref:Ribosome biogenesis GTPase A n=2 Tax=Ligilactobacillus TaxID=2767887 RepID=A0A0R2KM60_9LACO|nr:ribosome biogenesis GTP-binding protein YlqF [Ligilactobacillus ceti DSM 22408]